MSARIAGGRPAGRHASSGPFRRARSLPARISARLLPFLLLLAACSASGNGSGPAGDGAFKVVATTGQIADIAREVGGEYMEVTGLMGPGVDPHLYKASQNDVRKLSEADLILYNGLNLEGRMADIFVRMARDKPTVAVTDGIPEDRLQEPPAFAGHYDPHVWFDVSLWMTAVETVRDSFIDIDPAHRQIYEANAARYLEELEELDAWVRERISEIPEERRVLVTAHDAFGYFGLAYDIEVMALQGISTEAEYGLADVQNLVDVLVDRGIKAVFVESSISDAAIRSVVEGARQRGHEVVIGGQLFSDALGDAGTPEGTYIGMIRHNVETIVAALK